MPSSHTIHRHHHHFGWDNANAPVLVVAPGDTVEFETVDSSGGQLSADLDAGRSGGARLRQGQPGDRPGPHRRGRARRRAEGHDPVVCAVGLGLDRQHPGLRAAGGPVPGAGAAYVEIRSVEPGTGRLRAGRARAAQAVRRHDRAGAGRTRPAQHRPAPRAAAATWTSATSPPAPSSICRSRSRAPCSRSATPTPPRATARSAARRSRARCRWRCGSTWSRAPTCATPRFTTPGPVTRHLDGAGYEVTTGIGPDLMQAARDAVSAMIDLLAGTLRHARRSTPTCCAACAPTCGSARSSIMPNWVVSLYFPRIVLQ